MVTYKTFFPCCLRFPASGRRWVLGDSIGSEAAVTTAVLGGLRTDQACGVCVPAAQGTGSSAFWINYRDSIGQAALSVASVFSRIG